MYQIMLLILWNIHDKLSENFAKRMARKDFIFNDVLQFRAMPRRLKIFQHNFAQDFRWLPSILVVKAFLIITESTFF